MELTSDSASHIQQDQDINRVTHEELQSIAEIAISGMYVDAWSVLRKRIRKRAAQVIDSYIRINGPEKLRQDQQMGSNMAREFYSVQSMRDRVLKSLISRDTAPFTLQRICEVLLNPGKQFRSTQKLLRSLEKLVSVTSNLDPVPPSHRLIRSELLPQELIEDNLEVHVPGVLKPPTSSGYFANDSCESSNVETTTTPVNTTNEVEASSTANDNVTTTSELFDISDYLASDDSENEQPVTSINNSNTTSSALSVSKRQRVESPEKETDANIFFEPQSHIDSVSSVQNGSGDSITSDALQTESDSTGISSSDIFADQNSSPPSVAYT